jgi:hypothetical protein
MARTRKTEPDSTETPAGRIDYMLKLTKGTMPMTMLVRTEAEAAELNRLLKAKGKKAANLSVKVSDRATR